MKNNFCDLQQEAIHKLPGRFKGFLLSPFHLQVHNGYVMVPDDCFKEMIDIIAEYAQIANAPDVSPLMQSGVLTSKDAERYRWLRERDVNTINQGGIFVGMTPNNVVINGIDLDVAIEEAMAIEKAQL
jgi:hypothetical protein